MTKPGTAQINDLSQLQTVRERPGPVDVAAALLGRKNGDSFPHLMIVVRLIHGPACTNVDAMLETGATDNFNLVKQLDLGDSKKKDIGNGFICFVQLKNELNILQRPCAEAIDFYFYLKMPPCTLFIRRMHYAYVK